MRLIKKLLFPLFLLIEATLFFVILFAPLSFLAGNILRFSTVGIATIFGWIFLDQKPYFVICAALTFTCIADFLLEIVDPPERSAATTCFLLAQFVYAGYICSFAYNTAETVVHLSVRGLLTIQHRRNGRPFKRARPSDHRRGHHRLQGLKGQGGLSLPCFCGLFRQPHTQHHLLLHPFQGPSSARYRLPLFRPMRS